MLERTAQALVLIGALLATSSSPAQAPIALEFIAATPAYGNAVRLYESIWDQYGERIVAALEARTCLPFPEPEVAALVDDDTSHSGGPEHPMQLRATYPIDVKRSTLVHELGHRHLWQLGERLDDVDGHETLYLFLDLVWADVWGDEFAAARIGDESEWRAEYDYRAAWDWARSLDIDERTRVWNRLLQINGHARYCHALMIDAD